MPSYPLAEVFGFPTNNLSADADRHRRDRLCPFGNAVPNCTKTSLENPLGVCSVHGANGETVINCPVRFQEGWRIASDAAGFFFPPGTAWTSLTEVRLKDSIGKSAGNSAIVLLSYDALGRIIDYGLLQVQTVSVPGETSVFGDRGRKTAVALDTHTYNALPPVAEVDSAEADLAFFVYDLVLDTDRSRYALALSKTVYTKQDGGGAEAKAGKAAFLCELEKRLEMVLAK